MHTQIIVRDVTLREFGQNVPVQGLEHFTVERRLWLARALIDAGFTTIEVASTASATVAPAMDVDALRPFLETLGKSQPTELITLVPGRGGYQRFLELGLGPEGLDHTMGIFVSAMDEHNLANLRRTVDESLEEMSAYVPEANHCGTSVAGYVSAAFGFRPKPGDAVIEVNTGRVAELIERLVDLGASTVTLSDLQGVAGPSQTEELLQEVISGKRPSPVPIGYHPHHVSAERVLDNVEAAYRAGVGLFDASLGGVGGCVTGAPGNAPTEGVVERLHELGAVTNLDVERITALAREATERVYQPAQSAPA